MPTEDQIEAVASAIEDASRFGSRFNDWTSDHVPGLPIEIYDPDKMDTDGRVVARYPAHIGEEQALREYVRRQRALAALAAMGIK